MTSMFFVGASGSIHPREVPCFPGPGGKQFFRGGRTPAPPLKDGLGTEFILESIEFNAVIPDYVFSKASLKN
jgi:hypothetical protein